MTTSAPSQPLLTAEDPQRWLATHLQAHQSAHDEAHGVVDDGTRRWVGIAELLDDDAAVLRSGHTRMVAEDGTPPAAAAKWLVSWFAGGVADAAGFVYATGAAALLVHGDQVRFRLHPDGWPDRCDVGAAGFAVVDGHPWTGRPEVQVVGDEDALAMLAVAALTEAVTPLVDACRTLAKVGRAALWAEVVDGFGLPVLHQLDVPVDPDLVVRLHHAVRAPGRPWRQVPDLRAAGPGYLGRKAGCCLAYQCPEEPVAEEDVDDRQRAYLERFPRRDGEARYCSTCSLRDLAGCEERQVFWLEQEHAARSARLR